MKFPLQEYEKFIELVRSNPCLYHAGIAQYKDTVLRQNTWKKISKAMAKDSMTWEDWRKVWKQKRDAFMRRRREIIHSPSGWDAQMISKIPLYDQMSFLIGHIAKTSADSNLDELEQLSSSGGQVYASQVLTDDSSNQQMTSRSVGLDDIELDEAEDNTSQKAISQEPPCSKPKAKSKGRKRESTTEVDTLIQQLRERSKSNKAPIPAKSIAPKCSGPGEDDSNVFIFLSKKMKTFKESTQQWLEDEALKLYMEAKRRNQYY